MTRAEREFEASKARMIRKVRATQRAIGMPEQPDPVDCGVTHIGLTPACKHPEGETCNECTEVWWTE